MAFSPRDRDRFVTAAGLSPDIESVARLLAAGLTDLAVARELKVDERTVRRRVAMLLQDLEASTRFQAGYKYRGKKQEGSQ